eukprot:8826113-Ditylum_brightwellii.AAC.1
MFEMQFNVPSETNKSWISSMNSGLLRSNLLRHLKFSTILMLTLSFFGMRNMGNAYSAVSASSGNSFL